MMNPKDPISVNSAPGEISKNLQHALGIGPEQLPLHIYKMRQFGYPPGWLEFAKRRNISFAGKSSTTQRIHYKK